MTLLPKTCFFTGHRFISREILPLLKSALREELLNAINGGFTHFISGGAVGFDTMAAEEVINMREDYDMIKLVLYLPCKEHFLNWSEADKNRFHAVLSSADEVYYVSKEQYKEGCMRRRNLAMAEASDMCIAYLKNLQSGTAQAVKMAQNKGLSVINLAEKYIF